MVTYNQEKYIAKAIESVLSQRVNYNFELVIGEDNSTDFTKNIVTEYARKYPTLIKVISTEKNVGARKNSNRVAKACLGKYIAYCEGDDYWHDKDKLQKQVYFLENNSDYGLIHSDFDLFLEGDQRLIQSYNKRNKNNIPSGWIFYKLLDPSKYLIRTPTVCIRKEYLLNFPVYEIMAERGWHLGDLPLWLEISHHSKIKYLNESCATYRVLEESAGNTLDPLKKSKMHRAVYDVRYYMINKYGCPKKIKDKVDKHYSRALLGDAFRLQDVNIAKEAITELKQKGLKPKFKDWLYFYGAKRNLLNKIIRLFRKIK